MKSFQVLTVSGSLRAASCNTTMLAMAAQCAPAGLVLSPYTQLAALPLFNPDLEHAPPAEVRHWQSLIAQTDAVLIASPEYAHGVSGVMKNALDWTVASGVFVNKPVVLWNAAPRASIALAALSETLTVMSAQLCPQAALTLWVQAANPTQGLPAHNPDPAAMRAALQVLLDLLHARQETERTFVAV